MGGRDPGLWVSIFRPKRGWRSERVGDRTGKWDTPKTHPTWAGRENNSGKDDDGNGLGEIKYSYGRTGAGKCKKTILTGLRVTLSIYLRFASEETTPFAFIIALF
ncbi:uncharacterized protein LAJ45_02306 [Morchella importuna]|uniref:uncharacterized protein n=1 Tax=Morchella importuna TaxID=1174673 RepID=UPI001E8E1619|nr:uncharacterized protein LAJ45_02306 [Morchella importuna]KAH8153493.1 hypothetical protein LAJ45_02306 [Morchella importuna]